MKTRIIASLILATTLVTATAQVFADDHDNHQYVKHTEWKNHLRAPPHGYEWRLVDGNYVLAAVATGVIASVIVAAATGH